MGLLDEAIREHLELKRRRGADPGEIARAQHEALEFPRESSEAGDEPVPSMEDESDADVELGHLAQTPPEDYAAPTERPDFANVGQETAELDMQAVLDAEEREVSGRAERGEAVPGEVPGQERLSFE